MDCTKGDTDLKLYFLLGETVKREKEREREEGEMTENSRHIKTQQSVWRPRCFVTDGPGAGGDADQWRCYINRVRQAHCF